MCYLRNKSDTPAVACIINPVKQNVIKRRSLTGTSAERLTEASKGISLEGRVGERTVTFRPGVYLREEPADKQQSHSRWSKGGAQSERGMKGQDLQWEKLERRASTSKMCE